MKLIAYTRASTDDQKLTHGAQLEAIVRARPGDDLLPLQDTCSGKVPLAERPRGAIALRMLADGAVDGIVVSRLDRLARSTADFAQTIERARAEGWTIICLNPEVDLSTAGGKLVADVLMAIAEFERELISERTKEGLAELRRREPTWTPGGHAHQHPENVLARIRRERDRGLSLRAIADGLNADGVRTARDGRWHASTVRDVLRREPTPPPTSTRPPSPRPSKT